MWLVRMLLVLSVVVGFSAAANSSDIQGRVIDAQGVAVSGATVTASLDRQQAKSITAADGSYNIPNLQPGIYTVTVSAASMPTLRREVSLPGFGVVRADFRVPQAASSAAAAEEFNPNIFIFRIDQNEVRNRLQTARGPDPQYVPEFRAEQNYFGAEFGAPLFMFDPLRPTPLAREWRGTAVGFIQNSALNARNFFNVGPLLTSRSSTYGLTGSGPVLSRKATLLFQFGQNFTSGFVNGNAQVPQANERTPRSPDAQTNAIIAALLKAYPPQLPNLPQVSVRQLNSNAPRSIGAKDGIARLDLKPDGRNTYALRYSIDDYSEDPFQIVLGQNPQTDLRAQKAYANVIREISPSSIGQFGVYYDRLSAALKPTREYSALLSSLGYPTVPDFEFAPSPLTYSELYNIGPGPQFPRMRVQNQYRFYSDIAHSSGRHTLKAGWSIGRMQMNDLQSDNGRGTFSFTTDFGRTGAENFLMGTPSSFTKAVGNLYRGFRNWEGMLFVEDQIRAFPTLVLDVGLRYELMTAPREVNHLTSIGFRTDKNNFAPRFGFAWNPGKGNTVVRGAYGISYGTIPPTTYGMTRFNEPAVQVYTVTAPNLVTALNGGYATTRSERNLLDPNMVFPYTHQYNFSIERALPGATRLRVAYIGSRSFHLFTQQAFNRAAPIPGIQATTQNINERRPDPRYFGVYVAATNSIAYYDAAQVSVEKRLSHGLTFRAAYTHGKNLDLGGDFTNNGTTIQAPTEGGLPTCESCDSHFSDHKGPSLFDTPDAAVINFSYSIPSFYPGGGWQHAILRGWQISGTSTFQSGTPFHLHTGDAPGFGNVDGEGQDRPNILNPSLLGKSIDNPDTSRAVLGGDSCQSPSSAIPYLHCDYFDANIPLGGRGNMGMSTLRKKGTNNTNLAFGRTFRLPGDRERTLQIRTEFINLLNRAQFEKVGNQLTSLATFGKITNTVNKGRQLQFSLRLSF